LGTYLFRVGSAVMRFTNTT